MIGLRENSMSCGQRSPLSKVLARSQRLPGVRGLNVVNFPVDLHELGVEPRAAAGWEDRNNHESRDSFALRLKRHRIPFASDVTPDKVREN
jgi:hypothetical protein